MFKPVLDLGSAKYNILSHPSSAPSRGIDFSKPSRQRPQVQQVVDGPHLSLFNVRSGHCYLLSPLGKEVWSRLVEPITLDALVMSLPSNSRSSSKDLYDGVKQLCGELYMNGYIDQIY